MKKSFCLIFLFSFLLLTILPVVSVIQAQAQAGSVYDLIAAVNALRSAQGLTQLEMDGSLMASAQAHSEYQASIGYWSHEGANGSSPKDRAIAAGYGGGATVYVSENVAVVNSSTTFDTLINSFWSDSLHWNTMTNPSYTHVGAGIASAGDEIYYTLDVGYVAGNPGGYVSSGDSTTSAPGGGSLNATSVAGEIVSPVMTTTPQQDGSVVHVVQQGQSLWSIAIAYGTTILNIVELNNLDRDNPSIWAGNELLIQSSLVPSSTSPATATEPPATRTPRPSYTPRPIVPTKTATLVPTATLEPLIHLPSIRSIDRRSLGIAIIAVCAAGLLVVIITGFKPSK